MKKTILYLLYQYRTIWIANVLNIGFFAKLQTLANQLPSKIPTIELPKELEWLKLFGVEHLKNYEWVLHSTPFLFLLGGIVLSIVMYFAKKIVRICLFVFLVSVGVYLVLQNQAMVEQAVQTAIHQKR